MSIEKIARKMIEDKHFNLDHVNTNYSQGYRAVYYRSEDWTKVKIGELYEICILKSIETNRISSIDSYLRDWE
jgi:hypothetical protein